MTGLETYLPPSEPNPWLSLIVVLVVGGWLVIASRRGRS